MRYALFILAAYAAVLSPCVGTYKSGSDSKPVRKFCSGETLSITPLPWFAAEWEWYISGLCASSFVES
jgi:hypothetical protein